MHFLTFLKSLDDLLYEVMSWLVFFPITLWRVIRHPLDMMNYSDAEQGDVEQQQYTDTLSPPLFLLLALIISHALEIAVMGENALLADKRGLASFISSDTNLIALRIIVFSLFPLAMAVRLVRALRQKLDRETLKAPFYSQCYLAAVFALLVGLSMLLVAQHHAGRQSAGLVMLCVVLVWYVVLQTLWFSRHLGIGKITASGHAGLAMIEALIATVAVSLLFI